MSRKKYTLDSRKSLGDRIRAVRKKKDLTQPAFAQIIGLEPGYISQMEAGQKIPGSEILTSLKVNFKVNINWLLTGIGDMFETSYAPEVEGVAEHTRVYEPDINDLLKAAADILRSDNETVKSALKSNIIAFHYTVKCDKELENLKRDVDAMKKIINPKNPNTKAKGS